MNPPASTLRSILAPAALLAGLSCAAGAAVAADFSAGGVSIKSIAIESTAVLGHKPGNLEIMTDGFVFPSGTFNCHDKVYVTTLQTAGSFDLMFNLLLVAQNSGRKVNLRLSDDPTLNAFPDRCSLVAVELLAN